MLFWILATQAFETRVLIRLKELPVRSLWPRSVRMTSSLRERSPGKKKTRGEKLWALGRHPPPPCECSPPRPATAVSGFVREVGWTYGWLGKDVIDFAFSPRTPLSAMRRAKINDIRAYQRICKWKTYKYFLFDNRKRNHFIRRHCHLLL